MRLQGVDLLLFLFPTVLLGSSVFIFSSEMASVSGLLVMGAGRRVSPRIVCIFSRTEVKI